jgi:spore maturation protein CgeB
MPAARPEHAEAQRLLQREVRVCSLDPACAVRSVRALYQRTKIGFNVHNRGKYTVGSYRLFDLPGNGVMQISDGGEYLEAFFRDGEEIVGYKDADDLDKIRYYLDHDDERQAIALNGYRRVMRDHRFQHRMSEAVALIRRGMAHIGRPDETSGNG